MTIRFTTPWLHGAADIPGNMPEYSRTDLGNARRLVVASGEDIRYCHATRKWLLWSGSRWLKDQTGEIYLRAKQSVRAILTEAAFAADDAERKALVAHEQRSESEPRIRAMINLAQSEPKIPVQLHELDRNPMALNVLNGTLDLESGELHPHSRENLITKIAPVNFDPNASCPRWKRFLCTIMDNDDERIRFMARAAGYSLTGLTTEQVFFLCHGVGSNGKTTFIEVLRHMLGDYAQAADFSSFLISKGQTIRNDLAKLQGARFVSATESENGKRMAESVVKQLTGGDTISARFLYGEHFEFRPQFKLWLATNHKPKVVGSDDAFWRRVRLVPFTITIPKDQRDSKLPGRLSHEASGILNWALMGLRDWQQHGLNEPEIVLAATAEYRESQDALGHFIAGKCAVGPNREERACELYRSYKEATEAAGEFRMGERDFSSALVDRGFIKKRVGDRIGKPAGLYWKGISLAV